MDIVKSFKQRVVDNKNIIFISILFTCLLRIGMFLQLNGLYTTESTLRSSFLWDTLFSGFLLENNIASFVISFIVSLLIAFCLFQINARYGLIQVRTYIVPALALFFLSIHPIFMLMSGAYIGALCISVSIYILLSTYQKSKVSGASFYIGFLLMIGGLFDLQTLLFIPLFCIGLKMMRCVSLKSIIAMILGVISVCWLTLFALISIGSLNSFISYYKYFNLDIRWSLEQFTSPSFLYLIFILFIGIILFFNYQVNSYRDKIRIRANIIFFYWCMAFAFIFHLFCLGDNLLSLFVILITGSMLLSHFLSLATEKWKIIFFYTVCIFSLIMYYINVFG